jgi:ectoine hydroxylase-related dioxygenase (phytanoyl-CoA dioxygenase family)
MAELVHTSAEAPIDEIVALLDELGAVAIDGLLDGDRLARLNADLDPLLAAADPAHDHAFVNPAVAYFFGERTRHVTGVAGKSRVFASEVMTDPVLLGVCDGVLGGNCARYQLNLAHVLDRGPGSEQQLWHRDELVWIHLPVPHPEVQVASLIALADFTADNGATRVVPGSHRWERDRLPLDDEVAVAEMSAGSAVVYLGSTIHAGGANTTVDRWRRGMHLSFVVGWLRTEENHYLAAPPDAVRGLPRAAQELLGYAAHDAIADGGGYLGTVELQDPAELMADGRL